MTNSLGISPPHSVQRMWPSAACQRMCANLASIYSSRQEHATLLSTLELLTAANPRARDYLSHKHRGDNLLL